MKHTTLLLACFAVPFISTAQVWLDPTFGTGGVVSISLASGRDGATCMALQADGKIVVAGVYSPSPSEADFLVARYEANGALDMGFGIGGYSTYDVAAFDVVRDLALQADGGIVLVGTAQGVGTDKVVLRFTATGQIDPTFNGTGVLIIDDSALEDQLNGVAVQADQKIVAVGQGFDNSKDAFYICRLNSDGTFDDSFGIGGQVEHSITSDNCRANDVAILPDGRILSVGTSYTDGTTQFDGAAVRYMADGTLDTGFDGDGRVVLPWSTFDDNALAVLVQPDGKVLVGGAESEVGPNARVVVTRLSESGSPDAAFGVNGTVRTYTGIEPTRCGALALAMDGHIVVGGVTAASGVARRSYVCRLSADDGALDPDFGSAGELFHPSTGPDEETPAVALQPDGKIVLAGTGGAGISLDVRLLRYLETPLTGIADAAAAGPMRLLHADARGAEVLITSPDRLTFQVVDMKGAMVGDPGSRAYAPGVQRIDFGALLEPGPYSLVLRTVHTTTTARFVVMP
jgi:uncharacterized delta-60 repeat protein